MATSSEPLGFFDIPREIRDEIYRQYFSKRYRIPSNVAGGKIDYSMILLRKPRGPRTSSTPRYTRSSHSRILQISQRMRCEAEDILFHDCSFYLRLANPQLANAEPSDMCQTLADRITKLDVSILTTPEITYSDPILQRFIGGEIGPTYCSFSIQGNTSQSFRSTSLLKALLKKFVRYETVIVKLRVPYWITKQLPGEKLCQGRRKAYWPPMVPQYVTPTMTKAHQSLEEGRNKMRTYLESTLGPGAIFDEGSDEGSYNCVEFHPIVHSTRQRC